MRTTINSHYGLLCQVPLCSAALGEQSAYPSDAIWAIDGTQLRSTVDCIAEADINQSGGADPVCDDITIGDIAQLIDYLFITQDPGLMPDCL
jgi:hypothetical protein